MDQSSRSNAEHMSTQDRDSALGEFFSECPVRESGAVLVRPDGVIAWKAVDDSAVSKLNYVLQRLLGFKS